MITLVMSKIRKTTTKAVSQSVTAAQVTQETKHTQKQPVVSVIKDIQHQAPSSTGLAPRQ